MGPGHPLDLEDRTAFDHDAEDVSPEEVELASVPTILQQMDGIERLGRYELHYEIGVGGMAKVYLARVGGPGGFEKWFAVKRIHDHLASDKRFLDMFLDESRIAAAVDHPNVAQVFELGMHDGEPFIAMEYLHGETLSELRERAAEAWGRTPPALAAFIVANAAEGLHHAHGVRDPDGNPLGLVHRDVTPHNLFLTYRGQVKLTDFGIAKAAGRLTHTRAGTIKGKVAYMAPEQALGGRVDRRVDIWALGLVLWELAVGHAPFAGLGEAAMLMEISQANVPAPSSMVKGFPRALERIIMCALAKEPADRYATAGDLARELEAFIVSTGEPMGTRQLAAAMYDLFHDRIESKGQVLRSHPEFQPARLSVEVALPKSEPPPPPPPPSSGEGSREVEKQGSAWPWVVLASLFSLGLGVGGAWFFLAGPMAEEGALVRVETDPPGATVTLDGTALKETTPVLLEQVKPGGHRLEVALKGHQEREVDVSLKPGDRVDLVYRLRPEPTTPD